MKKQLLTVGLLAGALAMMGTGCISSEASRVGEPISVHMPVHVKPQIETESTLIEGKASVHTLFWFITWGPLEQAVGVDYGVSNSNSALPIQLHRNANIARNAAVYNATSGANADIIFAPRYKVTTKDYLFYKQVTCTVKGYPGYIKGVEVVDDPIPSVVK